MKFELFFQEQNHNYMVSVYTNPESYRWEPGGGSFLSLRSECSKVKWYSGIIKIKKVGHFQPEFFSFKSFQVRDEDLPELNFKTLFSVDVNHLEEVCKKISFNAVTQEKQPFPFIEISRNFYESATISSNDNDPQHDYRDALLDG